MVMNMLESYRPDERRKTRQAPTTRPTGNWVYSDFDPNNPPELTPEQKAEIAALAAMPEEELDFSDIPPLAERERARKHKIRIRNPFLNPPTKTRLDGFMIDSDIIYWVLNQVGGEGYMDKLNAMLRRAMEEERAEAR